MHPKTPAKRARRRCRCEPPRPIRIEDRSRNGVRVRVYVFRKGTVVDASCSCFGSGFRVHNNEKCPQLIAARAWAGL